MLKSAAESATFNPAIVRSFFDNLISSVRSCAAKRAINCMKLAEYCAPSAAFGPAIIESPHQPTERNTCVLHAQRGTPFVVRNSISWLLKNLARRCSKPLVQNPLAIEDLIVSRGDMKNERAKKVVGQSAAADCQLRASEILDYVAYSNAKLFAYPRGSRSEFGSRR